VQLGAQAAKGTAAPHQLLSVRVDTVHESEKPLFGRVQLIQFDPKCSELPESPRPWLDWS
jgi:hypothetical protein